MCLKCCGIALWSDEIFDSCRVRLKLLPMSLLNELIAEAVLLDFCRLAVPYISFTWGNAKDCLGPKKLVNNILSV